jgi:hypothetical protein
MILRVENLKKTYTRGVLLRRPTFTLEADLAFDAARDRLAIHYHQSYQVRRFRKLVPSLFLAPSPTERPLVHLFDEPQFNTADGYIGFMLDFFRRLRREGRLVLVCLHPTARYHLEILKEIAEEFLLVAGGKVARKPDFKTLVTDGAVRTYLGPEMSAAAEELL